MEGEEGCREVGTEEEQNNIIEEELAGAIAAGKAPQFEVVKCNLQNSYARTRRGTASRLHLELVLLLDGRLIVITDRQAVKTRVKNGHAFDGRLGSVDLLERAFRRALQRRWPKVGQYLKEMRIGSYSVFAADYAQSHHVRVTFRTSCYERQALRTVVREGVDTLGVTRDALATIFHWVAWRLLRRLRGEQRKNGNSC